jgi:hypothetical protein
MRAAESCNQTFERVAPAETRLAWLASVTRVCANVASTLRAVGNWQARYHAPLNVSADRIAESFNLCKVALCPLLPPVTQKWPDQWYLRDIDMRRRSDVTRRCLREIRFVLRASCKYWPNVRVFARELAEIERRAQVSVVYENHFNTEK